MPDISRILEMLDREDALELPDDEPVEDDFDAYAIDWDGVFPPRRPQRDGAPWELYGDEWNLDPDAVEEILEEAGTRIGDDRAIDWDVWAWYQPIHFYGPTWGIYITETGLAQLAKQIAATVPVSSSSMGTGPAGPAHFAKSVLRAAFAFLFLHEQYHHKVESAGIRMHVIEQAPRYPSYSRLVYQPARGTNDLIEEGLANADAHRRMGEPVHRRWVPSFIATPAKHYVRRSFSTSPPGYANATRLLLPGAFEAEQNRLLGALQEATLTPKRPYPADFALASHLTRSLFNIRQQMWVLVPRGTRPRLPVHPGTAPIKTKRLAKAIEGEGFSLVPKQGAGSHSKYRNSAGQMIILRDEKDVSLPVLKSTAATLGITIRELQRFSS